MFHAVHKVVHDYCFPGKDRIRVHLRLQESAAADHSVYVPVHTAAVPEECLRCTDGRLRQAPVDTFPADTVLETAAQTFLTVLMSIRIIQHMVGTDKLIVMGSVHDPALSASFSPPFCDLQDHGRRQLIVEIIEMTHVRPEIIKYHPQLLPGLGGIDRFDRIGQLRQHGSLMKIHVAGICAHPVSHTSALVLHSKILYFMPLFLQEIA